VISRGEDFVQAIVHWDRNYGSLVQFPAWAFQVMALNKGGLLMKLIFLPGIRVINKKSPNDTPSEIKRQRFSKPISAYPGKLGIM